MRNLYFNWMRDKVCPTDKQNYDTLLNYLNEVEYDYVDLRDCNREGDGIELRYKFADEMGIPQAQVAEELDSDICSVLEMLVALSIRIEEIMFDLVEENPSRWFWYMIYSLGLEGMCDDKFNKEEVDYILDRWMSGKFDGETGQGGLFILRNEENVDLTTIEVWCLAMWYLEEVEYGS